jgi:hypothetical protein
MKTLKLLGNIATYLAIFFAICGLIWWMPSACTRPNDTTRILQQQGYKNIEITGWRPFAKSEEDVFSTGFSATSPSGEAVTGTVTSGWLKGGTIRLD